MSVPFHGIFLDGETLRGVPVLLTAATGRLQSGETPPMIDVSLADVRASDRLADVPRFLYLPDNRTIETSDNAAVDTLLSAQQRGGVVRFVHSLETHVRVAAVATVLLVATTTAAIWWGLPVLARRAALAVPASIELQAGRVSLATANKVLAPSNLGAADRKRVQAQLDNLMKKGDVPGSPQLVFRSMGGKFPNAFALPGGIIVVSDELVELADADEEIAAVLAHELGHWQRRHGLQGLLRSSTALLVVSTVTGDLSTLTTFAGTIPFTLLQRGYSREFEAEADDYAIRLMDRAKIDPRYFESILKKLEDTRPMAGQDFTYLSTHPSTGDRIAALHALAGRLGWKNTEPLALAPKTVKSAVPTFALPARAKAILTVENSPDVQPRSLVRSAPFYPVALRAQHISGSVTVEFIVDQTGAVRDATVIRSSDKRFEAAALSAVSFWKFEPGRKNGRAINVRASQLLQFDADEEQPKVADAPSQ